MTGNASHNPTPSRRRSLFDLLDDLIPHPRPARRRPAKEIPFGEQRRVPATARDRAAEERMRRPFG